MSLRELIARVCSIRLSFALDPGNTDGAPPRARRSLWALGAVAAGLVAARHGTTPGGSAAWFGVSLLMLAIAAAAHGWTARITLWCALAALAGGWLTVRVHETSSDHLCRLIDADPLAEPAMVSVEGVITDWPEPLVHRGSLARFLRSTTACACTLEVWRAQRADGAWLDVSGSLRVRIEAGPTQLEPVVHPGAVLRLSGRVAPIRPAQNPGEPDWTALARQAGAAGSLHVPSVDLVERALPESTPEQSDAWMYRALGAARRFAFTTLRTSADDRASLAEPDSATEPGPGPSRLAQTRALLGAMLLGEKSPTLDEVNAAFARLGLLHLVAISGFNLVVMAGVAMFLLRLGGERGWLEPIGVGLLIAAYMLVLPAQAPIFRAGAIALVFLVAEALGRRYDRLTLLGWIAIVDLAIRPLDLWSPGFQLSFGVVAGLLVLGDPVRDRIFGPVIRGVLPPGVRPGPIGLRDHAAGVARWMNGAMKAHVSATVIAWSIATPIVAYHTGLVSPLAVVTTLIVLPLTVVVLWVGYSALLIGAVVPPVAPAAAALLDTVGTLLVQVVMTLDRVPATSFRLPKLSLGLALAGVALAVHWLCRGRLRSRGTWLLTLLVFVWGGAELFLGPRTAVGGRFRLDTLAVGDGSCHLLRSWNGWFREPGTALWDCGSMSPGLGERRIPDALRELGVWSVPTVILTHAHVDHFSALADVLEPLGVRRVLVSPQFLRSASARPQGAAGSLLTAVRAQNIELAVISEGDRLSLGRTRVEVLWPPSDRDFRDPNDASLVARFSTFIGARDRTILLTGDIAREAIPEMLPSPGESAQHLRADVIEAPHHGAYLDAAAELIRLADPAVVVQSTGPTRARDPRWSLLRARLDRRWIVTCLDGASSTILARDGSIQARPLTQAPRR